MMPFHDGVWLSPELTPHLGLPGPTTAAFVSEISLDSQQNLSTSSALLAVNASLLPHHKTGADPKYQETDYSLKPNSDKAIGGQQRGRFV